MRSLPSAADPVPRSDDAPTVLFIGGLGRSGSTLLDLMLGQQPGFTAVGELSYIWLRGLVENELCGCGQRFLDCPFWGEVGSKAFGGWSEIDGRRILRLKHDVDRIRHVPQLAVPRGRFASQLGSYAGLLGRLYAGIKEASGNPIVVDSTKHASTAYVLTHVEGIDLRIVHLIRDSRGVAYSWTKQVRKPEVTDGDAYLDRYHPARIGARWVGYNVLFDVLGARSGSSSLSVRYEDLIAAPIAQLSRIAAFAGRPVGGSVVGVADGSVSIPLTHTIAGNPIRFSRDRVSLRADMEWKELMPAKQRRLVSAISLPMLLRYGYLSADRSKEPRGKTLT